MKRLQFFLLCLATFGTQLCTAQTPKSWWPDPSTGLMWTGNEDVTKMNWQQASSYCASLSLGGFTGWRLPTLDEMRGDEYLYPVDLARRWGGGTAVFLGFKGGVSTTIGTHIWTSTSVSDNQKWSVYIGPYDPWGMFCKHPVGGHECVSRISDRNYALCTRPLEADLLHIAKDAQVNHPVPDVQTLKNIVPLNKARLAFQAGQYQESVAQAQSALTLKADPATAYWGMGISYGMLGQWEQAISNLESALKIDKNYGDAKDSLKWARDCQKAAKNGKSAKDKPPVWE